MDEKIDIKKILRVFDLIITKGEKVGDEHHLNGLSAISGFDGYTVTIRNDYASLDVFFHNAFTFNYNNQKEKVAFLEKIEAIARLDD
jgi:hypothetical protein